MLARNPICIIPIQFEGALETAQPVVENDLHTSAHLKIDNSDIFSLVLNIFRTGGGIDFENLTNLF